MADVVALVRRFPLIGTTASVIVFKQIEQAQLLDMKLAGTGTLQHLAQPTASFTMCSRAKTFCPSSNFTSSGKTCALHSAAMRANSSMRSAERAADGYAGVHSGMQPYGAGACGSKRPRPGEFQPACCGGGHFPPAVHDSRLMAAQGAMNGAMSSGPFPPAALGGGGMFPPAAHGYGQQQAMGGHWPMPPASNSGGLFLPPMQTHGPGGYPPMQMGQMAAPPMAAPQMAAPPMVAPQQMAAAPQQMAAPPMAAPQMAGPPMAAPQMGAPQLGGDPQLGDQTPSVPPMGESLLGGAPMAGPPIGDFSMAGAPMAAPPMAGPPMAAPSGGGCGYTAAPCCQPCCSNPFSSAISSEGDLLGCAGSNGSDRAVHAGLTCGTANVWPLAADGGAPSAPAPTGTSDRDLKLASDLTLLTSAAAAPASSDGPTPQQELDQLLVAAATRASAVASVGGSGVAPTPQQELDQLLDVLPACYLAWSSMQDRHMHLMMLRKLEHNKEHNPAQLVLTAWIFPDEGSTQSTLRLHLVCFDQPGVLGRVSAILYMSGITILEAGAFCTTDQRALDIFSLQTCSVETAQKADQAIKAALIDGLKPPP